MPQERGKEADCKLPQPDITSLGRWPLAEKNIRDWARARGLPSEEIEQFLDEIKKARGRPVPYSPSENLNSHYWPVYRGFVGGTNDDEVF